MISRSPLLFVFIALFIFTSTPGWAQNFALGTNAPAISYAAADAAYVDMFVHFSAWWQMPNHNAPQVTATGYPSQPGSYQCFGYTNGYPSGIYNFYGEGDFSISFSGVVYQQWPNNGFIPGTLKKVGNITTGQVQIIVPPVTLGGAYSGNPPNFADMIVNLTPTNANNPPANFHFTRPDYPAYPNTGATFGKEYLQAYGPFCCIRFMDWMGTNNSPVTTWDSRPNPNLFGCSGAGSCYEKMIELCNETNCDMWICIPIQSTDDWASNMALLIKQKLKPNLHVYVEFSNENWNWGGPAFNPDWQLIEAWDQTNSALTTTGAWARHGQEVAFLLMHDIGIMQPILGSQLRPVLAGQFSNTIYCSAGLAWIQQVYGPPQNYIYGIAVAPYFGGSGNDIDTLMQSMSTSINGSIAQQLQQNIALSKQYNVAMLCYESGQSLVPSSAAQYPLYSAAQYDPRMGNLYLNYATMLKNNGVSLCNFYNLLSGYNQYGFWGAMEDIRQVNDGTSVKFNAQAAAALGCNCGNAPTPFSAASGGRGSSGSGSSGSGSSGSGSSSSGSSGSGSSGSGSSGSGSSGSGSSGSGSSGSGSNRSQVIMGGGSSGGSTSSGSTSSGSTSGSGSGTVSNGENSNSSTSKNPRSVGPASQPVFGP